LGKEKEIAFLMNGFPAFSVPAFPPGMFLTFRDFMYRAFDTLFKGNAVIHKTALLIAETAVIRIDGTVEISAEIDQVKHGHLTMCTKVLRHYL
jgi:hypothetical protein